MSEPIRAEAINSRSYGNEDRGWWVLLTFFDDKGKVELEERIGYKDWGYGDNGFFTEAEALAIASKINAPDPIAIIEEELDRYKSDIPLHVKAQIMFNLKSRLSK